MSLNRAQEALTAAQVCLERNLSYSATSNVAEKSLDLLLTEGILVLAGVEDV